MLATEVRDRTRHAKHAMKASGGQVQPLARAGEKPPGIGVNAAVHLEPAPGSPRVAPVAPVPTVLKRA
jgi:hypothetical protein